MVEELGAMVANALSTKIAFEMNRTLYLQFAKAKNAIFKYHSTDIRYDFWGTGVVRGAFCNRTVWYVGDSIKLCRYQYAGITAGRCRLDTHQTVGFGALDLIAGSIVLVHLHSFERDTSSILA